MAAHTDSTAHDTSDLHPAEQLRTYWVIFYWLMGLLVLTLIAGRINLDRIVGGLNAVVALTIATIKGMLVVLFFMHVKKSSKLTWTFASAAFIWLVIMITLTFNDYLTREKIEPAGATPTVAPKHFGTRRRTRSRRFSKYIYGGRRFLQGRPPACIRRVLGSGGLAVLWGEGRPVRQAKAGVTGWCFYSPGRGLGGLGFCVIRLDSD